MSIATTIKNQIGPGALMAIGAHTMLATETGIIIHMGRGHRNKLIISLRNDDTYTISVGKLKRDLSYMENEIADGVYCDQLSEIVSGLR